MAEFWLAVIIGSLAVYSWKLIGYILPKKFSENKKVSGFAASLTIALLAALSAVQSFTADKDIVLDSRALALGVAAIMFWRKLPFILVVASAAAVAAAARLFLGWQ